MKLNDILFLKFPDAFKSVPPKIIIQDDSDGAYIKEWNMQHPLPTEQDLQAWEIELDLVYRQHIARISRVYPRMQEQLDMLYWDNINGTTNWVDAVTAVKEANPIPSE